MAARRSYQADSPYMGDLVDSVKNLLTSAATNVESGVTTVEDALSAPFKAISAVGAGVGQTATGISSTVKMLPYVLIIIALGVGAYLVFRGKSEKGGLI